MTRSADEASEVLLNEKNERGSGRSYPRGKEPDVMNATEGLVEWNRASATDTQSKTAMTMTRTFFLRIKRG